MKIFHKVDDTAAPLLKEPQPCLPDSLKRSLSDEISLPLHDDSSSTHKKKVRFQSNLKDSDYQPNEDIEITKLKKLSHECCGPRKELHVALCTGNETKVIELLGGFNNEDRIKIL